MSSVPHMMSTSLARQVLDFTKELLKKDFDVELRETGVLGDDIGKALIMMHDLTAIAHPERLPANQEQVALLSIFGNRVEEDDPTDLDCEHTTFAHFLFEIGMQKFLPKFEDFGCKEDTLSMIVRLDVQGVQEFVQCVSDRPGGPPFSDFERWYLGYHFKKLKEHFQAIVV
ncbi:unnamed protein product [Cyclocybe aegerita]|uniref:Uncharacterized protein n=1 Tax=Cyclocybe aegerita TaxID=1973307 RepID=A0A8S0W577_CYCAE|nr:unnamed protein product [Cyclocybe aegerita]